MRLSDLLIEMDPVHMSIATHAGKIILRRDRKREPFVIDVKATPVDDLPPVTVRELTEWGKK